MCKFCEFEDNGHSVGVAELLVEGEENFIQILQGKYEGGVHHPHGYYLYFCNEESGLELDTEIHYCPVCGRKLNENG